MCKYGGGPGGNGGRPGGNGGLNFGAFAFNPDGLDINF